MSASEVWRAFSVAHDGQIPADSAAYRLVVDDRSGYQAVADGLVADARAHRIHLSPETMDRLRPARHDCLCEGRGVEAVGGLDSLCRCRGGELGRTWMARAAPR